MFDYADYCVCDMKYIGSLINRVRRMMEKGWTPIGGIAVAPNGRFVQAMVMTYED